MTYWPVNLGALTPRQQYNNRIQVQMIRSPLHQTKVSGDRKEVVQQLSMIVVKFRANWRKVGAQGLRKSSRNSNLTIQLNFRQRCSKHLTTWIRMTRLSLTSSREDSLTFRWIFTLSACQSISVPNSKLMQIRSSEKSPQPKVKTTTVKHLNKRQMKNKCMVRRCQRELGRMRLPFLELKQSLSKSKNETHQKRRHHHSKKFCSSRWARPRYTSQIQHHPTTQSNCYHHWLT